jgi:hypothetical protein
MLVDAARDLGEQVGGVNVTELGAFVDRVAHRFPEVRQRRGHVRDMRLGVGDPQPPVWFEERTLCGGLDRTLGSAAEGTGPFGDLVERDRFILRSMEPLIRSSSVSTTPSLARRSLPGFRCRC